MANSPFLDQFGQFNPTIFDQGGQEVVRKKSRLPDGLLAGVKSFFGQLLAINSHVVPLQLEGNISKIEGGVIKGANVVFTEHFVEMGSHGKLG